MSKIPETFHNGYAVLYTTYAGEPIGNSPFRKNKDAHQILRDHMSVGDWAWAEGHMMRHDRPAYRKWETYKYEQYSHLLKNVAVCEDEIFDIKFHEWLRVQVASTWNYTDKQKGQTEHWRQLWALYTKTVETIYKRKHHTDHPSYTGDSIFNPNSLFE